MSRNSHPEQTRNLIIDTAMQLFLEQGYEHTSIQDIINHLGGLSKGAIYHHFKSKEDIIMAVADKIYSNSGTELYKIANRTDLTGKEKLKLLFQSSLSYPGQKEMFQTAPDMLMNPKLLVLYLHNIIQKEAVDLLQRVIEEGIADGSIQTDYPKQLTEILLLTVNLWLNPMVYHCEPSEMTEKVKFYQYMMKQLNLDIIENDMIDSLQEFSSIYQNKRNSKT